MATFTVRVELKGDPTSKDYDKLHEAMEAEGFTRTIKDQKDKLYHLPAAEYAFVGTLDKAQVLAKAREAASKVRKKRAILVTESKGRTWDGLEPA